MRTWIIESRGIVRSTHFVCALRQTPKGFEQLTTWLKNRHAADVHIRMEATGACWEALALYLHGLEQHVSVINPAPHQSIRTKRALAPKDRRG
jgi:transposase